MVELVILGSGGSIPTLKRNHPAYLIRHEGWNLLFDCGEDAQRRIEPYGNNRKMAIFISHNHADHMLGIPGVLLRFSLLGRIKPMSIYAPAELIEFIKVAQSTIHLGTTFEATVYGVEPGVVFSEKDFSVRAFEVEHRGKAFGYEFTYQKPTGTFLPEKAKELNIPKGKLWSRLAKGENVHLEDGRQVRPEDVSLHPEKGLKIVYSGDTRPCDNVREAAKDADILLHEAMYTEEHSELAAERGHSTAKEAATIASECNVGLLILTHYSPRYEDGEVIIREAKKYFPNAVLARDLMSVKLNHDGNTEIVTPKN
ncbi:MAG: ribonuclease Z [Candidatus Thorarchaeota archaeon]|nr:ribonuclease Z [Candidatus Thorarchaeota archaeon]